MKVLVTGASGMVGRNLASYFKEKGVGTIPTDLTGWELSGDLLDRGFVFETLASQDFDAIVHLAAITEIKKTIEDPGLCFRVNCFGTLNMLELAKRKGVKRIIVASSANVFGAPKTNPVSEESPFDPRVPYDYSKVANENMAMGFYKSVGLPVSITRSWLLFGEYDQPTRATIRFIRACLKDEPLTLYNGGKDTTSPSHAVNYARLALSIINDDKALGQAFNFGGLGPVSIRELAETVKKLTGSKSELKLLPPRSELEKDPQISYPTIKKAQTLLGYTHEVTLEQGLQRTIDWVKKQE
ncbi:MAG: GDP-mannose 4,6-dehydratase [Nitrososphaerota archaeon]|nr:GDP-mannose 4,6-dehydratase [Nitrososphaerota archaeon]MDG6959244.1 GDP-mannose 4,6-dehydratase [Nitrososphaerota archaeon]MDG6969093.1 GDP-mannose 4,6-dehydratase [Nitrososphaerota archaeon]MDG6972026.1 GDP-mannose 4,6-dehydratase [Nitrososphaerota archaeon]MDG6973409.1 GDP-mannose 4,6-dehydratase [Nitrososphaerota archaeon]